MIEWLCIVVQKHVFVSVSDSGLFLICCTCFHQISGLCSYEIVLIKSVHSKVLYGKRVLVFMVSLFMSTIGGIVKLINITNEEYSGQLVCFRQMLQLGSWSSTLSIFISDVRGDAIAVERNIHASHNSRNSNVNKNMTMRCIKFIFHVPLININIFGINKTCFVITGPL